MTEYDQPIVAWEVNPGLLIPNTSLDILKILSFSKILGTLKGFITI